MKLYAPFLCALLLAASGCANGPWDAPPGSVLNDFEDMRISWFGCQTDPASGEPLNPNCNIEQPSPPVIFPLSLSVVNGETLLPVNNVWLSVTTGFKDIYVLPQEVIEAIALPDTDNWSDVAATDEVWAEFSGTFEGDYRPTYLETWTDNNGQVDVWVWIQKMPIDPSSGQAVQSSILVDIGVDSATLGLQSGS